MVNACILLKVIPTKTIKIVDEVLKISNVRKAYSVYGKFDIAIFVEVKDYEMMVKVTNQINSLDGIRSTETLLEA